MRDDNCRCGAVDVARKAMQPLGRLGFARLLVSLLLLCVLLSRSCHAAEESKGGAGVAREIRGRARQQLGGRAHLRHAARRHHNDLQHTEKH